MKANQQTLLAVQGMSCPSCVRHIKEALRDVDGIDAVDVRLADGQVMVKHTEDASVASLVEALRDAGYESSATSGA